MMRNFYRRWMSLLFLTWVFLNVYAFNNNIRTITLDKENHFLTAPRALEYQWFLNGSKITATGQSIKINTPGTYEVRMISEEGVKSTASIKLGITAEGEVYTIYILGDSTACEWTYNYPLTGWGQVFGYFFDENVVIKNEALSARSSKSFYNDHWAPIRDALQPGDFVFIQFGINDNKPDDPSRHTEPWSTFQDYLTLFVEESQARGAYPVILTPVRRNSWTNDSTVYDAWHDYPVAARALAGDLNVPLIDVDSLLAPLYESLGPDYTGPFMYMNLEPGEYPAHPNGYSDNVHFQEMGAIEIARLVTEAIENAVEDTILNRLIPHIKPSKKVTVSTNVPDETIFTRTSSYPEGLTITSKVIFDPAWDLLNWQNEQGDTLSEEDLYMFKMGTDSLSIIAILDTVPVPDCAGELNGKAYLDGCGDCVEGITGVPPCNSETSNGIYKLTLVRSELCIDGGEVITQEECTIENSQFWELSKVGSHYVISNTGSEKFLYCDDLAAEAKVTTSTEEMLWRMEKIGVDTFQFMPQDSIELVLDVFDARNPGGLLRLYNKTGGKSQQFVIWELDPENCSGYPCATSIEDLNTEIPLFKIVPNPVTNFARLEFETTPEHLITLELYNLSGERVFKKTGITERIFKFGRELSKGIYIVKVTVGNDIQISKLLKN